MSPSPFGRHGQLVSRVNTMLNIAIDAVECDATVLSEIDWIVSDDTVVRPDISVVCGGPPQRHIEQPPALVVEIISESSRDRDSEWKKELYEREGVQWYLIIDPDSDSLVCFHRNSTGGYSDFNADSILQISICETCKLNIEITGLFR